MAMPPRPPARDEADDGPYTDPRDPGPLPEQGPEQGPGPGEPPAPGDLVRTPDDELGIVVNVEHENPEHPPVVTVSILPPETRRYYPDDLTPNRPQ